MQGDWFSDTDSNTIAERHIRIGIVDTASLRIQPPIGHELVWVAEELGYDARTIPDIRPRENKAGKAEIFLLTVVVHCIYRARNSGARRNITVQHSNTLLPIVPRRT